MGLSDSLASLNADRLVRMMLCAAITAHFPSSYKAWKDHAATTAPAPPQFKQTALLLNGPAFQGLDFPTLPLPAIEYLQQHLRVLSGLYGMLRPLDVIQQYRLEMGTNLKESSVDTSNLYEFWKQAGLPQRLLEEVQSLKSKVGKPGQSRGLVSPDQSPSVLLEAPCHALMTALQVLLNVASQEYAKVADLPQLRTAVRVIDIAFLDDGRVVSVFAKRARGLFVRFIGMTQAHTIVDATKFDLEGYMYDQSLSSDDKLVFTRTKAARLAAAAAAAKKETVTKGKAPQAKAKTAQPKAKAKTARKGGDRKATCDNADEDDNADNGAPPAKIKPTQRTRVTRSSAK